MNAIRDTILFLLLVIPWALGFMGMTFFLSGKLEYQKVVAACEAELPRNEHCKLTAVPKLEAEAEEKE